MNTDINRRLTALEHAARNTLACRACAPQRGHAYCWHTMPEPFRSLVPKLETEWHQHVANVEGRELAN